MKKFLPLLFVLLFASCDSRNMLSVSSPDGELTLSVQCCDDGVLRYAFEADRMMMIDNSTLGYEGKWSVAKVESDRHRGVWHPLWGKRREVAERYNEAIATLVDGDNIMELHLRAYDDGVAFRYCLLRGELTEATEFNFADNFTVWSYNGEQANIGPELLMDVDSIRRPVLTMKCGDDRYMALHEADVRCGEPMILSSAKGETRFVLDAPKQSFVAGDESPWRVFFYGESVGEMVDSHLIELLSPDPDPEIDFSWVKPGVALWDWRMNGAKVDGFEYEMSYPSWVRAVDFAAESGISYLVLDANWYGPEFHTESDPLKGGKARDVQNIIKHGAERGVGIWLYLNDVAGRKYPLEQTLKLYSDWGAAGVKYGFMRGTRAERLERTRMITHLCAENHLLINYHDNPIHPYGQMRTYPNALTSEYCHAQLDAHRVFVPSTFVTSVFVNMLAGPLDMNNGMFDLRQGNTDRTDESKPVPSTLASEGARPLIVFSGATVMPDIPEYYRRYPSLLRFISAQKMPWVESRTLLGEIGEHIVMMRETDSHYLVGAAVNEEGATLDIPMTFLPKGTFEAELTRDGDDAHYLTNRESIEVEQIAVSASKPLRVSLAPGGGACLLIKK